MFVYDCVVIGGGPAGLSAAIYLGRYNRSVIVIDSGHGRWNTYEHNENYLGFPQGIHTRKLRELGKKQAKRFGTTFVKDKILFLHFENALFFSSSLKHRYLSRSVILATGVKDCYPGIENAQEYLGKSLFWCITCDGYKVRNKNVLVIGHTNSVVCTCLQLLNFTSNLFFVTNVAKGEGQITQDWIKKLKRANIPFYDTQIQEIHGENGFIKKIHLVNGESISDVYLFSQQGAIPKSDLAIQMGIKVNAEKYIETDEEQRTNVPLIYAAGDVTRMFAHQIVTAAHEGATAAQAANYDLYRPEQRES
jgi:thioredoxin reductase (NADPH)